MRISQGIEQDLVVAEQFPVLQTSTTAQGQVGQGRDMVRFMIGEANLQHLQAAVDRLDQADATNERVDGADTADPDAPTS